MSKATLDAQRNLHELQHQYHAWEGVFSLIRSLGTSLEVDRVATLSLMTVTGQLAIQRAALYLHEPAEEGLLLCQAIGVHRGRVLAPRLRVPDRLNAVLHDTEGVSKLRASYGLHPGILANFEYAGYLSDGSDFVGMVLLGPKLNGGEFDAYDQRLIQTMGVVVGMTVKKAMLHERLAQTMERMEQTEQLRRAIIDHVSHELSTPLLVIKDAAEMARTADPAVQGEFWNMHTEAVERLNQLVRAVTLVAEHNHETEVELEWVRVFDCIERVARPVVQRFQSRDVPIRFHFEQGSDVELHLNAHKLGAALDSIIDNAWKFRRADRPAIVINCYAARRGWWQGQDHVSRIALYRDADLAELVLDPTQVLFSEGERPDELEEADRLVFILEVIDSGVGVPEGEWESIFEPFRQASNSPTLGVRGAGMGLTAARKLIRDQNGGVELRSRVDEGSVFMLWLQARLV